MEEVDCIVIGAGVVGLAVARALALKGHEVVVVEAESQIGGHASSRNSEVIHAGIYYSHNSLKATLCVTGRELLYRYCDDHGVSYRRCGKLIVATSATELPGLETIRGKALANGVDDLAFLEERDVKRLERELSCTGALLSPSTGIVDSHGFMLALQGDAEDSGTKIAFNTPFERARAEADGFMVSTGGKAPIVFKTRRLVNAAGLWAPSLATRVEGLDCRFVPKAFFARGNYFALVGRTPFSHLVYPMPEPGGLGIHLTLDLAGRARFGPDVEWIDGVSYTVDEERSRSFYPAIRRYWPKLKDNALMPAYAGVRPKISGPSEPAADFRISGPAEHGLSGLINLFGIESPGLTASLSIAEVVAARLSES